MITEIIVGFIILTLGIGLISLIGYLVSIIFNLAREDYFIKGGFLLLSSLILILLSYGIGIWIINFLK